MKKIRNLFLYGGLDREDYYYVQDEIRKSNRNTLIVLIYVFVIVFALMALRTRIPSSAVYDNRFIYISTFIISALLSVLTKYLTKKNIYTILPLCYIFMFVLYAIAFVLSINNPKTVSISIVVTLVALPMIFTDAPWRINTVTLIVAIGYILLIKQFKSPAIYKTDLWNVITFSVISTGVEWAFVKQKFEGFYNAFKLKILSEKDLLTNINNRNKYEMDFVDHPDQNTHQIVAVYVDVNGLHELNNTQGHEAGDEMLKYVAKLMKNYFGASSTYRLGGDEFLGVGEENIEKVEATMKAIDRKLHEKHYYISYGLAKGNASEALFKEAEEKMYINKRTFYSHKENDRRRR